MVRSRTLTDIEARFLVWSFRASSIRVGLIVKAVDAEHNEAKALTVVADCTIRHCEIFWLSLGVLKLTGIKERGHGKDIYRRPTRGGQLVSVRSAPQYQGYESASLS